MNEIFENEDKKLFFREGKITYLRPLLKTDIRPEYLAWLNNPELNINSAHFRAWPTNENDIDDFFNNGQKDNSNIVFAACCKKTGEHFGNLSLNNIDWISRTAAQNANVGIKKFRAIHYFDCVNTILDYAFNTLNLNKITGGAEDPRTIDFMKRFGYKEEGVLKQQVYRDGEFRDLYLIGGLKEDYLLKQNKNKKKKI
tara:strand:+ start:98 stop:691 length:594 start_codon:yes stop_codon:yes gene_type:complete